VYLDHFNLREVPFALTPDTTFFLNRAGYQDALNVLLVALRGGEGFVKVTGEVGTGKTLLCRKLINTLGEEFDTAYLHNPYLEPADLLDAVAVELGIPVAESSGRHAQLQTLASALVERHLAGRSIVLCLDEAQAMPVHTLEVLRLLTNLETEKRKLIQVVLFGQPELDEVLQAESIRQLRQRITFSYKLVPMSRIALGNYVRHRLAVAARVDNGPVFEEAALDTLFRFSSGTPRLVNVLGHKALMVAFGRGEVCVTKRSVHLAAADTVIPISSSSLVRRRLGAWARAGLAGAAIGAACSAVLLAG